MANTQQLISDARWLVQELTEREGITDEEIDGALDQFLGNSADKMERHSFVISSAEAEAERLKKLAAKITAQSKKFSSTAARVRQHARDLLTARVDLLGWDEGRRVDTDMGAIYLTKREDFKVTDPKQMLEVFKEHRLDQYVRVKEELNKVELKASYKAGVALPEEAFDLIQVDTRYSVTFK